MKITKRNLIKLIKEHKDTQTSEKIKGFTDLIHQNLNKYDKHDDVFYLNKVLEICEAITSLTKSFIYNHNKQK